MYEWVCTVKHHEICDMIIFICMFIVIGMFRVRYGYTNAWHVAKWNVDCILYYSLCFHFRLLSTSIILLKWNAFGGGGLIQVKKIL